MTTPDREQWDRRPAKGEGSLPISTRGHMILVHIRTLRIITTSLADGLYALRESKCGILASICELIRKGADKGRRADNDYENDRLPLHHRSGGTSDTCQWIPRPRKPLHDRPGMDRGLGVEFAPR